MLGVERVLIFPHGEFDPNASLDTTPVAIAQQTGLILGLFYGDLVYDRRLGIKFLQRYTLGYLDSAQKGAENLYELKGVPFADLDPNKLQAADHAQVVFSQLPDYVTSPFIPRGFSRVGSLKPPSNKDEFLKRVSELINGVHEVIDGEVEKNATLEGYPLTLRTFGFFKVASELPFKSKVDEAKANPIPEARFNALLEEVQF